MATRLRLSSPSPQGAGSARRRLGASRLARADLPQGSRLTREIAGTALDGDIIVALDLGSVEAVRDRNATIVCFFWILRVVVTWWG